MLLFKTRPETLTDDEREYLFKQRRRDVIAKLAARVSDRQDRRKAVEARWLQCIEEYHSMLPAEVRARLAKTKRSQIFINHTRVKTDAMAAKLIDMLFPTDDQNWGIKPTPVPELEHAAKIAADRMIKALKAAAGLPDDPAEAQIPAAEINETIEKSEDYLAELAAQREEAQRRCDAMEMEIKDQLLESNYYAECRDVIDSGCKLGAGIIKGPVLDDGHRRRWVAEPGSDVHTLDATDDGRPAMRAVNPWMFYWDPDATNVKDCDGIFELHLLSPAQMRRLARQGFDVEAIRRLMSEKGAAKPLPDFMAKIDSITGADTKSARRDAYHLWEYSGPLEPEEYALLSATTSEEADEGEVDPLTDVHVHLWFCGEEILKIGPHPLESGECLYSVFSLVNDESSVVGYGMPDIARDIQRAINGIYRLIMEHASLIAGPQIVLDPTTIEAADGENVLRAFKLWYRTGEAGQGASPFEVHEIKSNLGELMAIIEMLERELDTVTGLPLLVQGEQGANVHKTAEGMAMLMNSSNVVIRRIVRNFDDDVIVPVIQRMYDWNMAQSEKSHIKGDFEVVAKGSSVLLVREIQSQNLMMFAERFGPHPIYGPMLKHPKLLRKVLQAFMVSSEIMLTDQEIEQAMRAQSEQEEPQDPEMIKLQDAREERDLKREIKGIEREIAMLRLAADQDIGLQKIEAMLTDKREQRASDERKLAGEIGAREQFGDGAGGSV